MKYQPQIANKIAEWGFFGANINTGAVYWGVHISDGTIVEIPLVQKDLIEIYDCTLCGETIDIFDVPISDTGGNAIVHYQCIVGEGDHEVVEGKEV